MCADQKLTMEEIQEHVRQRVVEVDTHANEIRNLADNLRNAVPQINLAAFTEGIEKLQLEFRTQGVKNSVRTFSGEGARKFADWLKDMRKAAALMGGEDGTMKTLALQTLQGSAGDFLARKIRANPGLTWDEIKRIMTDQYSDLADAQLALRQLRKMKQKNDENVQNFAERLIVLADDAYPGEDIDEDYIQQQLVETFTDGVKEGSIARKLLRQRPETLNAAVEIATQEQQTTRAYELRRQETPMEVDAIGQIEKALEKRVDELASKVDNALSLLVAAVQQPAQVQQPPQAQSTSNRRQNSGSNPRRQRNNTNVNYEFTETGRPICYFCKRIGHIQSRCRSKNSQQNQNSQAQGN